MVAEPVKEHRGQLLVAEDLNPLGEREVGGDDYGAALAIQFDRGREEGDLRLLARPELAGGEPAAHEQADEPRRALESRGLREYVLMLEQVTCRGEGFVVLAPRR